MKSAEELEGDHTELSSLTFSYQGLRIPFYGFLVSLTKEFKVDSEGSLKTIY